MKRLCSLVVVALLLSAAGCGSGDDDESTSSGAAPSAAAHNDADVEFARGMILHHEQAVEMAELAPSRSQDEEVLALAGAIEAAQEPEIRTLEGWLQDWGEPVEEGPHHGGSGDAMGMAGEDDMTVLEGARGPEFDRSFLEMMIRHHRGAIDMAEQELERGEFPDAKAMAEQIATTQEAEITEMERLLEEI